MEHTYKGITIKETQGLPDHNYAIAVLDGPYLVVTEDPKVIERTIDTAQGGASLAITPGYMDAFSQIQDSTSSLAKLYLNLPIAAAIASAQSVQPLPPQNLALFQQNWQGLATTVILEPEGLLWKSISWLKPHSTKTLVVENNAKIMPTLLPANTLMMLSGGNLQRLWQDYQQDANYNPLNTVSPDWLRKAIASTTGTDIDQDIIPWMAGEFSLSLIPGSDNSPEKLPLGMVLMVQSNNRRAAEKFLGQLDEVMKIKYKFKVTETKLNEQPAIAWTSPQGGVNFFHGWLDHNIAYLTIGGPVANSIVPKPTDTLTTNKVWQTSVPNQLNPNNGNFFIDVDQMINNGKYSLFQLPPNQKDWINSIHVMGLTLAVTSDRTTRYDIFVKLKKEGESTGGK